MNIDYLMKEWCKVCIYKKICTQEMRDECESAPASRKVMLAKMLKKN